MVRLDFSLRIVGYDECPSWPIDLSQVQASTGAKQRRWDSIKGVTRGGDKQKRQRQEMSERKAQMRASLTVFAVLQRDPLDPLFYLSNYSRRSGSGQIAAMLAKADEMMPYAFPLLLRHNRPSLHEPFTAREGASCRARRVALGSLQEGCAENI